MLQRSCIRCAWELARDVSTGACDDVFAREPAVLRAHTADRPVCGSRSSPPVPASRGCVDSEAVVAHARSRECAVAGRTGHELGSSCTSRHARTGPAPEPCERSPRSAPEPTPPSRVGALASELFSDDFSQDVLVQRQIAEHVLNSLPRASAQLQALEARMRVDSARLQ